MKVIKNLITKHGGKIAAFSLSLAAIVILPCRYILHQPKEPEELLRYKKEFYD